MTKIAIIGSGDIAQKAYLPIISRRNVDLHLFARNSNAASNIAREYGIKNIHSTIDSLIDAGVKGAFVHTSTASHYEIITKLLSNGIHVYVDKPVTYDYASTKEVFEFANAHNTQLMVGFNRRYAPAYKSLKQLANVNMIVMQKNRKALPGDVRTFIFDDFIHVVDTLLYLSPNREHSLTVSAMKRDGLLYHLVVQLIFPDGLVAIGIMNRDSGTVEEKLEVFTPGGKWQVNNVTDTVIFQDKNELKIGNNDWESTLFRRGFNQIVDEFLAGLEGDVSLPFQLPDPLVTHRVCEEIVEVLSK